MKIVICILTIAVSILATNVIMNLLVRSVYKSMGFDIDDISSRLAKKLVRKFFKKRR